MGKQEVKVSLFVDEVSIYPINRKSYRLTKKLLELINELSRVTGYKINLQKLDVFLYSNNKLSEKKNKKTKLFTMATCCRIRSACLGIYTPSR